MKNRLILTLAATLLAGGTLTAHEGDSTAPLCDPPKTAVATGSGAHSYTLVPGWGDVPEKLSIGPTHGGVVVDKAGLIYVSSDGQEKGIYVFSPDGKLASTFGPDAAGIHGLCINEENGKEFIYGADLRRSQIVKLTLTGDPVLKIPVPVECGAYKDGKGYKPTGVAVGPAGEIFVVDGYGTSLIHKFDAAGKYVKTFGGKGKEDGKFETCHGIALDKRGAKPLLLVCDRANRRLQHLDLDGNFVGVITTGLRLPCAVSIHGDFVAVAELEARVAILDKENKVVAVLGDNPDKSQWANFGVPINAWKPGIFTAPHGLSYDAAGNLYVQDWNKSGRITKLELKK